MYSSQKVMMHTLSQNIYDIFLIIDGPSYEEAQGRGTGAKKSRSEEKKFKE